MKLLTYQNVLDDLKDIIYKNGEETVADCHYTTVGPDGEVKPVCIVGHYFYMHGLLADDEWGAIEGDNAKAALEWLSMHNRIDFTLAAERLLLRVQESQDAGHPWVSALVYATLEIEEKGEEI